jgi:Spy/CpxP family protein refolding chaperone
MNYLNKQTVVAALVGGVSAVVLAAGGVAFAHGAGHGPKGRLTPEKIEEHLSEMTERLDLSAAQEQQVRTILEQALVKGEEIKEMPHSKEKFTAARDLRFATEDQIYANLSCEQRDELRLLEREHRIERMEARYRQHHQN